MEGTRRNTDNLKDAQDARTVLITGATRGIGYELSKVFAEKGFNLVLVARDKDRLLDCKKEFEKIGVKVKLIVKDLSVMDSAKEIYDELKKEKVSVNFLVNNAGFGDYGFFYENNIDTELSMIDVNITALTYLTQLFLRDMIKNKSGKILNVASVAAYLPGPKMAVYYATKAYVLSFSEALSNELKGTGVTVTALCPGPTKTEFAKRANFSNVTLFNKFAMDARSVAVIGYEGMMKGKSVVIAGFANNLQVFFIRFLPRSLLASIVRKIQDGKSN